MAQSCLSPWTAACQAPLSIGILQARILEWVACLPPWDLPNPEIEPRPPTSQADSLPSEPPGKPKNPRVGSLQGPGIYGALAKYQKFYSGSPVKE